MGIEIVEGTISEEVEELVDAVEVVTCGKIGNVNNPNGEIPGVNELLPETGFDANNNGDAVADAVDPFVGINPLLTETAGEANTNGAATEEVAVSVVVDVLFNETATEVDPLYSDTTGDTSFTDTAGIANSKGGTTEDAVVPGAENTVV